MTLIRNKLLKMSQEGPNDGLVSVKSAKWVCGGQGVQLFTDKYAKKGKYLGTLNDVNHLDLVGWINPARYKWAEFTGREIKFKPAVSPMGFP